MHMQIGKVKELLAKSKALKDEIKFDIYDANTEIDKYIEQIAQDFILDGLVTNQTSQVRVMEAQLSNL